jgi:hypothetical protein
MLVNAETALHRFCTRIFGWTADREIAVEHAIRSIELATDHSATLVLLGETDLVSVAHALHRCTLGPEHPATRAKRSACHARPRRQEPPMILVILCRVGGSAI